MTDAGVCHLTTFDQVKHRQRARNSSAREKRCHESSGAAAQPAPALVDITASAANLQATTKRPCCEFSRQSRLSASKINTVKNGSQVLPSSSSRPLPQIYVPGPSQNPLLSLSHPRYGLPQALVKNFASLGIKSIYPWQSSCLLGRGLLDGERNLVYTAPTGGGKSLVADVLMLKRVTENASKKAILVLPYVALVQEKLKWLRKVVEAVAKRPISTDLDGSQLPLWRKPHVESVRVVGYFGNSKSGAKWSDFDIAVCIIEKANGLINIAIEESTIQDLGIIVLDELHMIDDDHRGYLMELTASKILTLEQPVQIVGMSATLTNTEILAKWLHAKYYNTQFVPVPMEEFLVYDRSIYATASSSAFFKTASQLNSQSLSHTSPVRLVQTSEHSEFKNPILDAVAALAIETAVANCGALIFCGGRQACQNTALLISEAMSVDCDESICDRRQDTLAQLRSLSVGLDDTLERTVARGVAFHHAGLTVEEREIIADAYDNGTIRVIVATCSLAAGINLPARRVILFGARMGRELIGPAMLRQMRGRAGRKGKDELGESYLCCQKSDLEDVVHLLEADLPPVKSGLTAENQGIKRALLEIITTRLATHPVALQEYVRQTLLYHSAAELDPVETVATVIDELLQSGLVVRDRFGGYEATSLSQAIVASYLTPEDGVFLHQELTKALQAFVMDGEMHVFYTFTPVTLSGTAEINWPVFRKEIDHLDESGLRVLDLVGVRAAFVNRMANGSLPLEESTPAEVAQARIHRRFYAALQLRDLSNEMPIHTVARKYQVSRGSVQTLSQICEGFAGNVIRFCDRMGWGMLRAALDHMSDRLKAGARADLLELAQIPFVKSRTARILWDNGFRSLRAISEVGAGDLVPVLELAQPKTRKARLSEDDEAKYQQKLRLKAEIIISSASRIWEKLQQQQYLDIEGEI